MGDGLKPGLPSFFFVHVCQFFTDGIKNEFFGIQSLGLTEGLHPLEQGFGDKGGNRRVRLLVVVLAHRKVPC